jgi:cobaltochelatase CobS
MRLGLYKYLRQNPLAYSLDRALTFRAEPSEREAIHRIAKDVFGDDWV